MIQFIDNRKGFTLIEVILAAAFLVIVLSGLLATYISCFELISTSRNLSLAVNAARVMIEEIRDYSFNQIHSDYDNTTFTVNEMSVGNSRGVIYVDNTNPDLLQVIVSVCWRQRANRIIGEDLDLDGNLDAGEDTNANSMIDSPAQLVTLITAR